ncbi:Bacterial Ig-like domain (group 2) [uncultured archaeon]|nr:Bacterial Ig-like domain (group 2) [uncultured archaeon]
MKNKILITLSALILLVYPMAAYAYNQATPATFSVNYTVSTDTSFTVTLASGSPQQTAMNFTGARNILGVEPQGQSMSTSKPWATINNTGQVNQDFKVSLAAPGNPPTIELLISNNNLMSENIAVTTTPSSPNGWTNVAAYGGKAYLYAVANFRNTPDNPGSRTLSIASMERQVLTSIVVIPASASVPESTSQTYTATGKDQFGNTMSGITFTWSRSNPAAGSINPSTGVFTAAGPAAIGQTTNITASNGSVTSNNATATIVGQTPVLTSILVSPLSANVPENRTQTYTATGKDQYGNTMSGITFTWSRSNPAAGSINPSTGVFTPAAGASGNTTNINASSGSVFNNAATATIIGPVPLTSISITPTTSSITETQTLAFTATDQDGYPITELVTWHSDNTGIATISTAGVLLPTGTAFGDVHVTATYGSATSNKATITVTVG